MASRASKRADTDECSKRELETFLCGASAQDLRTLLRIVLNKCKDAEEIARDEVHKGYNMRRLAESQARGDQRWKICVRCEQPYDTKGQDLVCEERCHPGELEPDDDHACWGDWNPDCQSLEEAAEDLPEAFLYTCCGQAGDTKGCENEVYHSSE